jgi:hypothetical protein
LTRILGNAINSLVQVVDNNGDKVTDAVVNYKVYFYDYDDHEVWEIAESGLMTHIGDGLYQAEWTPEFTGEYTFYAYSTNPKFHESYTYFIEEPTSSGGVNCTNNEINYLQGTNEQDIWLAAQAGSPPCARRKITVELDLAGFAYSIIVRIYKSNSAGNYRLISQKTWPDDFDSFDVKLLVIDLGYVEWWASQGAPANISLQSAQDHGQSIAVAVRSYEEYVDDTS